MRANSTVSIVILLFVHFLYAAAAVQTINRYQGTGAHPELSER
jgi:hypothetical protein